MYMLVELQFASINAVGIPLQILLHTTLFEIWFLITTLLLEVLLTPHKAEPRLREHVTLDVKCRTKTLRTAEEDTSFGWRVDLADRLEDHIPVRATKVCGCAQTGDGVLFGVGVVDHDVCCVVCLDLCGEVLSLSVSLILFFRNED
jgi:hypothetical protein